MRGVSLTGRENVLSNQSKGTVFVAIGVIIALAVGIALWLQQRGDSAGRRGGAQEFGAVLDALADVPDGSETAESGEIADAGRAADAKEEDAQPAGEAPAQKVVPPYQRKGLPQFGREALNNQIYGRPAGKFSYDRLSSIGVSREEAESLREKFEAFAAAARELEPDGRIRSALRKTREERAAFRELRKKFLTDWEFDAALYATNQMNRSYFGGPVPAHKAAGKVGLRERDGLLMINGVRVFDTTDYSDARDRLIEGQMHELVVQRGNELYDVKLLCCEPGWGRVLLRLEKPVRLEAKAE